MARAAKRKAPKPKHTIHRLRITLAHIEPPIWREIEVESEFPLGVLHDAIQIVFGWEESHLWRFTAGRREFGDPGLIENFEGEDAEEHTLREVAPKVGSRLGYEYDFGDGWEHAIEVVAIEPTREREIMRCTGGARACPPEDSGGAGGYENLLAALADPDHPEHEQMLEWLGGPFDPEAFDLAQVNDALTEWNTPPTPEQAAAARSVLQLLASGEHLPDAVREQILAHGEAAVRPLLMTLTAEELLDDASAGGGWAPIHAARLLGALKDARAIEPMLAVLAASDSELVIHDAVLLALPKIGPAVVEPVLRDLAATDDPDQQSGLREILSEAGARDPRIWRILLEAFEADPERGASDLGSYGDPAALPILSARFDRAAAETRDSPERRVLVEIQGAIVDLGGDLTSEQAAALARWLEPTADADG